MTIHGYTAHSKDGQSRGALVQSGLLTSGKTSLLEESGIGWLIFTRKPALARPRHVCRLRRGRALFYHDAEQLSVTKVRSRGEVAANVKLLKWPTWPTKAAKPGVFAVTEDLFAKRSSRSAGGPKLLKWGLPARVKSAKVRPTPYVNYPPARRAPRRGARGGANAGAAGRRAAARRGAPISQTQSSECSIKSQTHRVSLSVFQVPHSAFPGIGPEVESNPL